MTTAEEILGRAARDLSELGASFALVGGFAVSARTEPRFTKDVDLAVAVATDAEAETLVRALLPRGYRLLAMVEQDSVGRLATARLLPEGEPEEGIVLDLLFALRAVVDAGELDRARRAVALIEERGFRRGKALGQELETIPRRRTVMPGVWRRCASVARVRRLR